ncbi:UDP-N-acetylmuramate dehydrogenase [Candidatus Wolfebacteria bacterium]|nr:UDP-N-acetylmuramate dehydrogenase [Candidatus Wolfebacteria bacterium]
MLKIKKNYSMKYLSTFKIGGRARFFAEVKIERDFFEAIKKSKEFNVPCAIIGNGSNIVFSDGLIDYFFIKLSIVGLKIFNNKIIVGAGLDLAKIIKIANKNGLAGLETLAGIPGTIGGAIVGNVGAYGHSISEVVEKVEIWNGYKKQWLKNKDCNFSYRESIFKNKSYIILRAILKFNTGKANKLKKISAGIIKIRNKKYKKGLLCPGSFFKNVLISHISKRSLNLISKIGKNKIINGKIPAGYLLEQIGANGMRFGGIKVADFHGNLLFNQEEATAKDVRKAAQILKNKVYRKFNIELQEEVKYF